MRRLLLSSALCPISRTFSRADLLRTWRLAWNREREIATVVIRKAA